jgi:hypothetical protein
LGGVVFGIGGGEDVADGVVGGSGVEGLGAVSCGCLGLTVELVVDRVAID